MCVGLSERATALWHAEQLITAHITNSGMDGHIEELVTVRVMDVLNMAFDQCEVVIRRWSIFLKPPRDKCIVWAGWPSRTHTALAPHSATLCSEILPKPVFAAVLRLTWFFAYVVLHILKLCPRTTQCW